MTDAMGAAVAAQLTALRAQVRALDAQLEAALATLLADDEAPDRPCQHRPERLARTLTGDATCLDCGSAVVVAGGSA